MRILMIFNGRVSNYTCLSIQLIMLTLEELFPSALSLNMLQKIKTMTTQLLLGTCTHIWSTLIVMIHPLLCISLTSFLMLVYFLFLMYRSLSSLPPLLCFPLITFLTLMDNPFIQYISLPGLPLLVAEITLDLFQYVRIVWTPYFKKWLIITAL